MAVLPALPLCSELLVNSALVLSSEGQGHDREGCSPRHGPPTQLGLAPGTLKRVPGFFVSPHGQHPPWSPRTRCPLAGYGGAWPWDWLWRAGSGGAGAGGPHSPPSGGLASPGRPAGSAPPSQTDKRSDGGPHVAQAPSVQTVTPRPAHHPKTKAFPARKREGFLFHAAPFQGRFSVWKPQGQAGAIPSHTEHHSCGSGPCRSG